MNDSLFSNLNYWKILCKTAESGNFSRAAIDLNIEPSRVSRTVSMIEAELGEKLFLRSARPMQLTEFGQKIVSKVQPCLNQWAVFEQFAKAPESARHAIRLSMPTGLSRLYLNKPIAEYAQIDPSVTIESRSDEGLEELLAGDIDLAFISYVPDRGDLIVYPVINAFPVPLASAAYVKNHGRPQNPEDLIHHTGILKSGRHFPAADYLIRRKERRSVFWKHVIRHSDILNVKDAVLQGMGIALDIPPSMVLKELKSGEIVQVLDNWHRDYLHYSIITRSENTESTPVGRFAAWYARRVTAEMDEKRQIGFSLLGLRPDEL